MPLQAFCPGCKTKHTFLDLLFGKKVRCKNCEKYFYAGQPEKGVDNIPPAEDLVPVEAHVIAKPPPLPRKGLRYRDRVRDRDRDPIEDDFEGEVAPSKRSRTGLILGLGIGVPLLAGVVVLILVLGRGGAEKDIPGAQNQQPAADPRDFQNPKGKPVEPGKLITLGRGTEFRKFQETVSVVGVALSADGRRVLSIPALAGTMHVWDLQNPDAPVSIKGHNSNPVATFTPDGKRVLSCGREGDLLLWSSVTGGKISQRPGDFGGDSGLVLSPDGRIALLRSASALITWDVVKWGQVRRYQNVPRIRCQAISPDNRRALLGLEDNSVRLMDLDKGEEIRSLIGHGANVNSVAFSPDGLRAASGSADRTARVWDLENGQTLAVCKIRGAGIDHVTFYPGGRHILTSGGNSMHIWDAQTGQPQVHFTGGSKVTGIAVSGDGQFVAASDYDRTVRVWRINKK